MLGGGPLSNGDPSPGRGQTRDIPSDGKIEADAKPRVPDRRECRTARMVEEEVPYHVGRPAKGQESGPTLWCRGRQQCHESRADQLQAEMAHGSPALQA